MPKIPAERLRLEADATSLESNHVSVVYSVIVKAQPITISSWYTTGSTT